MAEIWEDGDIVTVKFNRAWNTITGPLTRRQQDTEIILLKTNISLLQVYYYVCMCRPISNKTLQQRWPIRFEVI